jgi:hypothetical protein
MAGSSLPKPPSQHLDVTGIKNSFQKIIDSYGVPMDNDG